MMENTELSKMLWVIDGLINADRIDEIGPYINNHISVVNLLSDLLNQNRIKDIKALINSMNENQTESKEWLMRKAETHLDMFDEAKILVIAGWYGLLGEMLRVYGFDDITILDMDPTCKELGKRLYPDLKFHTDDIANYDISDYDIVVCTACEHLTDEVINGFISKRKKDSLIILQSNDYFGIDGHINCKETLEEFKQSITAAPVLDDKSKDIGPYTRYLVFAGSF